MRIRFRGRDLRAQLTREDGKAGRRGETLVQNRASGITFLLLTPAARPGTQTISAFTFTRIALPSRRERPEKDRLRDRLPRFVQTAYYAAPAERGDRAWWRSNANAPAPTLHARDLTHVRLPRRVAKHPPKRCTYVHPAVKAAGISKVQLARSTAPPRPLLHAEATKAQCMTCSRQCKAACMQDDRSLQNEALSRTSGGSASSLPMHIPSPTLFFLSASQYGQQ
ncbi:hypothetical protein MRX96_054443 [Rhipicephalus microplus]